MGWDMHHLLAHGEDYPDSVIVHKSGVREAGRQYMPKATDGDFSLRKAVEGLEGQVSALQAANEALAAQNKQLLADNGRMLLDIECLNAAGTVRAHIVDESTLDVQGVRFVRAGVDNA